MKLNVLDLEKAMSPIILENKIWWFENMLVSLRY